MPLWPDFMAFWGPDPIGGNPFTRIPYDVIFNEDWKGSKIYSETASLDEQIRKSLNYAYMNIAPSMPLVPGSWHQHRDYQLENKKAARGTYTDKQMDNFKRQFDDDMNSYIEKMKSLENAYRSIK